MSGFAFWFWPEADGPCRVVDSTQQLTAITEDQTVSGVEVTVASGARYLYNQSTGLSVSITHQFTLLTKPGQALARRLRALQLHLQTGGSVAFAADSSRAWGAWVGYRTGGSYGRISVARSKTVLPHAGNFFSRITPSAALAEGDEVVIEEALPPTPRRQLSRISTISATEITLDSDEPTIYDYRQAYVRHRDFYPILVLPEGGTFLLDDDDRITATLTATLEVDYAAMHELGRIADGAPLPLRDTITEGGMASLSIGELLARGEARRSGVGGRSGGSFGGPLVPWRR